MTSSSIPVSTYSPYNNPPAPSDAAFHELYQWEFMRRLMASKGIETDLKENPPPKITGEYSPFNAVPLPTSGRDEDMDRYMTEFMARSAAAKAAREK